MKDKELVLCLYGNLLVTENEYQKCDYCSMFFNENPYSRCLTSEIDTNENYQKLFQKALREYKLKRICQ